jgi:hypothetical protein
MDPRSTWIRSLSLTLSDLLPLMNIVFLWCTALGSGSESAYDVLKVKLTMQIVMN